MLKSMLAFSRDRFCWHTGTPVKESYLKEGGMEGGHVRNCFSIIYRFDFNVFVAAEDRCLFTR